MTTQQLRIAVGAAAAALVAIVMYLLSQGIITQEIATAAAAAIAAIAGYLNPKASS